QAQTPDRLQRPDDAVERHRFVVDVVVAAELRVDRYEIVDAAYFDAVPGIIDHRHIRILRGDQKFPHHALEFDDPEIVAGNHYFEADRLEQVGDCGGIVDRVAQRGRIAVG